METYELTSDNFEDTIREFIDNPKDTKPLLITIVVGECTVGQCVKFSKDIYKLAAIVKKQNRVAHVACMNEDKLC